MVNVTIVAILALFLPSLVRAERIIRFEGNQYFDSKRLRSELHAPRISDSLSEAEWRDWEIRAEEVLAALYADRGFFDVKVESEAGPGRESGSGKALVFRVTEGIRYRFAGIEVTVGDGAPVLIDLDALEAISGEPFELEGIYRDRRLIARVYGNKGYVHARVAEDIALVSQSHSVRVNYKVNPGNLVVFDTLMVANSREGAQHTKAGLTNPVVFRSLLGLRRGDTVSAEAVAELEKKLRSTGIFNYVQVRDSVLENAEGRSALVLKAEEAFPGELQAGLFYETQYGPGVSLEWRHYNLAGRMHEGKWGISFAQRRQSHSLGYGSPLFFGTSVRFDNDLYMNWYQDQGQAYHRGLYDGDFEIANDAQLSRSFSRFARLISSTELRGESQLRGDNSRIRGVNLNYINSAFLTVLDNLFSPTSGWRTSLTWGNGGPLIRKGNLQFYDFRHNWVESKIAAYLPFGVAVRLEGGRFFEKGGLNSQRFFLGGPRSVRSYGWRRLCPRLQVEVGCESDLEPMYGLGSFEWRFQPIPPGWVGRDSYLRHISQFQWVPFVDYGSVWPVGKAIHPEGVGLALGLGVRYNLLSIFNLRLDYAWDPRLEGQSQWVLDLAQAF